MLLIRKGGFRWKNGVSLVGWIEKLKNHIEMKKYIFIVRKILTFLVVVVLFSCQSFAQIEIKKDEPRFIIGTLKTAGTLQAELFYRVIENDTIYTLLYRNQEYQSIIEYETVSFSDEDGTLEKFYSLLKSVFKDENKKNKEYRVNFKLGNSDVMIVNFRVLSTPQAMFMAKGHVVLSEKQIDKLFGK